MCVCACIFLLQSFFTFLSFFETFIFLSFGSVRWAIRGDVDASLESKAKQEKRRKNKSNRKTSAQSIWNITCTAAATVTVICCRRVRREQWLGGNCLGQIRKNFVCVFFFSSFCCYSSVKIVDARDSTDSIESDANEEHTENIKRRRRRRRYSKRKKTRANTTQHKAQHCPAWRRRDKNWNELCACVCALVDCVPHQRNSFGPSDSLKWKINLYYT